jgi:serine protease AprX
MLAAALMALAMIVLAGPLSVGDAAGPRDRAAALPPAALPVLADRNGDRILDGFEPRLRAASDSDELNVIVILNAPASAARVRGLERAVGPFSTHRRFSVINGFSARMSKRQVVALAADPSVEHIEENSVVHALNDTAQSSFGVTKARIDAPGLDGNADGDVSTYSSGDLVVAVIDTGIDASHQDLDEGKVIAFQDYVNGSLTPYDDDGHGTHVAAIAAGEGDARPDRLYRGVAPAAALVGIKVLDSNGNGFEDDVIAGIQYAITNKAALGIEVINLSLGIAGCSAGTDAVSAAIGSAYDAGLVPAVAAGNEGPGRCTVGSPGAAAKALTVGGMADLGEGGFYEYFASSRGKTADGRIKPDISAPAIDITSARAGMPTGYINYTGTSMATPFVAGVAALMLDANPGLTPQQVKDKITGTAIDWGRGGDNITAGSTGADIDYGAGRLDAYAALQSAGAPLNSPPLEPVHEFREGSLSGDGDQDDYVFNVPDTMFPIGATLIMPTISGPRSSTLEFELYLLDPNGSVVASSAVHYPSANRQQELGFFPSVAGNYTLRVRSYDGTGQYFLDFTSGRTGYARPQGATPNVIRLVPAFDSCGAPNHTHGAPLAVPSCSPPVESSDYLTVGTPDANGKGANSTGFVQLKTVGESPINPNNGDQADVQITAELTDVRKRSDLSDYTGELRGVVGLRITDRISSPGQLVPATAADLNLGFTIGCAATTDPATGASCNVATSADTLAAGTVLEGRRAIWEVSQVDVFDGGADNDGDTTGDNTRFATQGLYAP